MDSETESETDTETADGEGAPPPVILSNELRPDFPGVEFAVPLLMREMDLRPPEDNAPPGPMAHNITGKPKP